MPTPTLSDVHVNSVLSNLSIGFRNPQYIADQIFPVVTVQKKSDAYYVFDQAAWLTDDIEPRAPGTRATRSGYTISTASYIAINYTHATTVPDEVRANADAPLRPDVRATEWVTDKLLLGLERRVSTVIATCTSWASASNPGTLWSNDSSDVLADIDTLKDAIVQQIGREPNTVVMGYPVWMALKRHPDLLDRIKYTERGVLNLAVARELFGVERIIVGQGIYSTSQQDASTQTHAYIWGKNFFACWVPANADIMTPAAGYVFEWKARKISQYREEQEHQDVFEAEHFTAECITASTAGGGMYGVC